LLGYIRLLKNISWQQFETILAELGESRAARLSYSNGWLEIMVPLPEHEKDNRTVQQNLRVGRSQAIREFKRWVIERRLG